MAQALVLISCYDSSRNPLTSPYDFLDPELISGCLTESGTVTLCLRKTWNWHLNPGHLVADEEWLCSPVYPDSAVRFASGMLFQIDIIPSLPG